MLNEHMDGLLEGHEPRSTGIFTIALIIVCIVISTVAVVLNIALLKHQGSHFSSFVNAVGILILIGLTLIHLKWYKNDHQEKKQKHAIYVLVFAILLLDVAAFMVASETLHYQEPLPCPETNTTTTAAPNFSNVNVF
ncbi:uncharacterized protein TM35_000051260 [Trypanosoma theileri]|uniref:Transmembrane protein n=1 Tax=Trypanosoma theileri TaxID=67003 RepID=A0A1X0P518_9TRYP|nr:uncharacterized protein TM35_000051260 [Trypanosoma theileri]ORC91530.1 hypothetical protein TM35_000051260 [Trypanosoma theileri]